MVAEILVKKSRAEKLAVYSIAQIENIKGYLFIETLDELNITKLLQKVKHVKGFLKKPVTLEEISKLINTVKEPIAAIEVSDMVEMISGPFKGEKAKVTKVDHEKDCVTVELVEVAVPIPITVKSKMIKLYQKAEKA